MDPISVAASVVGLLTAATKISSTMQGLVSATETSGLSQRVQHEIRDITAVVAQLQAFILGNFSPEPSRESMIDVHQVLVTLTGTVCTFSELEKEVDGLKNDTDMRILDRAKWLWKEQNITRLCQRLQDHKSSLSLMLTILTCKSSTEAKSSVETLCTLVGQLIESNADMSNRLRMLESSMLAPQDDAANDDIASITTTPSLKQVHGDRRLNPFRLDFEDTLFATRVYKNTLLRNSVVSLTSSKPPTAQWSVLSGLSLADVSNISILSLPLSASELYNSRWYDKAQRTGGGSATEEPERLGQRSKLTRYPPSTITVPGKTNSDRPKPRSETGRRIEGFSDLMNSVFGTPPRMSISPPANPVHVTHVRYDYYTGQLTGLPIVWRRTLEEAGILEKEQEPNPQAILDIMVAYEDKTEIKDGERIWKKVDNANSQEAQEHQLPLCSLPPLSSYPVRHGNNPTTPLPAPLNGGRSRGPPTPSLTQEELLHPGRPVSWPSGTPISPYSETLASPPSSIRGPPAVEGESEGDLPIAVYASPQQEFETTTVPTMLTEGQKS
ncbi:MAG: hypothetical protein M1839_004303 [Geoglossum umbratile]|nr:MAG: hypothetical protein M1839_004303 [Geoglossum umbratile]